MKHKRALLMAFGLLDLISCVSTLYIIRWNVFNFSPEFTWWMNGLWALDMLLLGSFLFSSYGFIRLRKWAIVLSWIQFPLRFLFLVLSFGFLTTIPFLRFLMGGYQNVLIVAAALELGRLIVTIFIFRRWKKAT